MCEIFHAVVTQLLQITPVSISYLVYNEGTFQILVETSAGQEDFAIIRSVFDR